MAAMNRRDLLKIMGAGALTAALPARAQGAGPLRLGVQTSVWGSVGLIAEAEKLFDKVGANVTVNKFDSGAAARDAMIGGHIDVGSIGATPFIIGVAKSNLVAIGTVAYAGGTLSLVAGKKSGVTTVAGLKGKKVASQVGSQTDYVFQNKIAPAAGLKKGDVQVINVKFHDHVAALASGSVEAFAGVEPYPSVAEVEGIATILTDYTRYDIVPVILSTNHDVLAKREADLVRFMQGWMLAAKLYREEPQKAANIIGNFYRSRGYSMKDDIFKLALSRMDVTPTYRPELKAYLTDLSQTLVKTKRLNGVPNIDRALDQRIQKKIA